MSDVLDELKTVLLAATEWHDARGAPTVETVMEMTKDWPSSISDADKQLAAEVFSLASLGLYDEIRREMVEAIDAFAESHPGLGDQTQECEKCHGKFGPEGVSVVYTKFNAATLQARLCLKCLGETDMNEYYGFVTSFTGANPACATKEEG